MLRLLENSMALAAIWAHDLIQEQDELFEQIMTEADFESLLANFRQPVDDRIFTAIDEMPLKHQIPSEKLVSWLNLLDNEE